MQHVRAEEPALYIKGLLCSHFAKSLWKNSSNMLSLLQENESLIKLVPSSLGWWGLRNNNFSTLWFPRALVPVAYSAVHTGDELAVWHFRRTPLPRLLISWWRWDDRTTWRTNCSFRRPWWEEETPGVAQKGGVQAAQHSCHSRTISWDVESWDVEGPSNELG